MDVALVTYADFGPSYGPNDVHLLAAALARRGISAALVPWDDPAMDWATARMCIIRATWDYHLRLPEFLTWAAHAAAVSSLWNPLDVVRWNTDKTYLRALEARGIATIPTVWLPSGSAPDLAALLRERDWPMAVLKPVVSASAHETILIRRGALREGQAHLARLLSTHDMMLQPFVAAVTTTGEHSLVFIDGEPMYTLRRHPAVGVATEGDSTPIPSVEDEVAFARGVLQAAGYETLYARVDIVRDDAGVLRLMELELVEPGLWLAFAPEAVERFADAIVARLPESSSATM